MSNWRRLPCDNYDHINKEVWAYLESTNKVNDSKEFWNTVDTLAFVKATPLLQSWLGSLNLRIRSIGLTVAKSLEIGRAHV